MRRRNMYRAGLVAVCWGVAAAASVCLAVADDAGGDERIVEVEGTRFRVAEGMTVELAVGPELVARPITADFDEEGRLYVSESSGSNDPVQQQLEAKPHRILRLEDTDGDGRYDKRVVYADGMMFPEGTMWFDGSLYVAAPPSIWKLTDTDGDGVADEREEWFEGKTLTGCANDLHGPYLGRDGWIYWCKGAFAEQRYERAGKADFVTRAAHIFRRRPEGGEIEAVMTGGMDNPVDVVFTPGGERIFTTTFLQRPGGGRRDGLIHAIYGGVYGKIHGVIDDHPRTGEVMPVMVHLGAAAPSGLVHLESGAWGALGAGYRGNLLAALFNMQKVTRHVLKKEGATFAAETTDFLATEDIDFHPTDVIEDGDGSVLVVDTGGWYKLCCPTSQLWKPDVLGAIYRVRREDAARVKDAWGKEIDWEGLEVAELVELLRDERPRVRERAMWALAEMGEASVEALVELAKPAAAGGAWTNEMRLAAVWSLCRNRSAAARAGVRVFLNDIEEDVRQAAIHAVSVNRDDDFASRRGLVGVRKARSMHNRRAAAEALGRMGLANRFGTESFSWMGGGDRALEHSEMYAVIESGDVDFAKQLVETGTRRREPLTIRMGLVALDQLEGGELKGADIARYLVDRDQKLQETAWWIARRHPEWGGGLAAFFEERIYSKGFADAEVEVLAERMAAFAGDAAVQEMMGRVLANGNASGRRVVLETMRASGVRQMPEATAEPVVQLLTEGDDGTVARAVAAVRTFEDAGSREAVRAALRKVVADEGRVARVRLEAASALGKGEAYGEGVIGFLCEQLDVEREAGTRSLAADVLLGAKLDAAARRRVGDALATTGPAELGRLLPMFEGESDAELGWAVIWALDANGASRALATALVRKGTGGFDEAVQEEVEALVEEIEAANGEKLARIEEIVAAVDGGEGDVRRGLAVFRSARAACSSCHELGYLGGQIGPDLSHIGRIRTAPDLAEAILFPSASFVRGYEPTTVMTTDGLIYTGVVTDETREEIVLVVDAEKTLRIRIDEIEERQPASESIMPKGLEKVLSRQEMVDLVKFLESTK